MPSPFPGMNPYLEQDGVRRDFHGTFVYRLRAQLVLQLPSPYFARIDQHTHRREVDGGSDIERVRFIEVRTLREEQLVTVVRLLSSTDKASGSARNRLTAERSDYERRGVNYVEIDLSRGGQAGPAGRPCYRALVVRTAGPTDVWSWGLRDPLPRLPIPLLPRDVEPTLDLQTALHTVYDEAWYEGYIYHGDPEPALSPEDAAWAAALVPRPGG